MGMSAEDNAWLARELYEAFNDRDFDRALQIATDDVEVVHVDFRQTARGPEEFRQFMEARRRCPPTERWRSPPVLYEER